MTAQACEIITIDGVEYGMRSLPLTPYLESQTPPITSEQIAEWYSTACWRCYIGHWRIEADQLLLDRMIGGRHMEPFEIDMTRIFPDRPAPILADWFTGKLRLPLEPMLIYAHRGWASSFRYERIIHVRAGQVVRERHVDHTSRFLAACGDIHTLLDVDRNPHSLSWLTDEGRALIAEHLGIDLPPTDSDEG